MSNEKKLIYAITERWEMKIIGEIRELAAICS